MRRDALERGRMPLDGLSDSIPDLRKKALPCLDASLESGASKSEMRTCYVGLTCLPSAFLFPQWKLTPFLAIVTERVKLMTLWQ